MRGFLCLLLVLTAGCSSDIEVTRTVQVSAERLATIQARPYARRFKAGGGPAARLAGLDGDPWPEGVLFLDFGEYLHELGFAKGMALHAIDGVGVHRLFEDRWATLSIRRAGGFHRDHYVDLVRTLFDAAPGERRVITLYRDVPSDVARVPGYTPVVVHWAIEFTGD